MLTYLGIVYAQQQALALLQLLHRLVDKVPLEPDNTAFRDHACKSNFATSYLLIPVKSLNSLK